MIRYHALAVVVVACALPASAATITWVGPAGGVFDDPANWSPGEVPDGDDVAQIGVAGVRIRDARVLDTLSFTSAGASVTIVGSGALDARLVQPTAAGRVDLEAGARLRVTGRLESAVSNTGGTLVIEGNADHAYFGNNNARYVFRSGPAPLPPAGFQRNLAIVRSGTGGGQLIIEPSGIEGQFFADESARFDETVFGRTVTGGPELPTTVRVNVVTDVLITEGTTPMTHEFDTIRVARELRLNSATVVLGRVVSDIGPGVGISPTVAPDTVHVQNLVIPEGTTAKVVTAVSLVTSVLVVGGRLDATRDLITDTYQHGILAEVTGPGLLFDDLRVDGGTGLLVDQLVYRGLGDHPVWTFVDDPLLPPLRMDCQCDASGLCPDSRLAICGSFTVAGPLSLENQSGEKRCEVGIIDECSSTTIGVLGDLTLGTTAVIAGNTGSTLVAGNSGGDPEFGDIRFDVVGNLEVGNYVFFDGPIVFHNGAPNVVNVRTSDAAFHARTPPLGGGALVFDADSAGGELVGDLTLGALLVDVAAGAVGISGDLDVGTASLGQTYRFPVNKDLVVRKSLATLPSVRNGPPRLTTFSRPASRFDGLDFYVDVVGLDFRATTPHPVVRVDRDTALAPGPSGFGGALDRLTLGNGATLLGPTVGPQVRIAAAIIELEGQAGFRGIAIDDRTAPLRLFGAVNLGNNIGIDFGAVCGNGQIDPGEDCDDGNGWYGVRGCSPTCASVASVEPLCGNAILEAGEECDDGDLVDDNGCTAACVFTTAPTSLCGDGVLACADEECDDGNSVDGDGCSRFCEREGPSTFFWTGDDSVDAFDRFNDGCNAWSPAGVPREGDTIVYEVPYRRHIPCTGSVAPRVSVVLTGRFIGEVCLSNSELERVSVDSGLLRWETRERARASSVVVTGDGGIQLGPAEIDRFSFDGRFFRSRLLSVTTAMFFDDSFSGGGEGPGDITTIVGPEEFAVVGHEEYGVLRFDPKEPDVPISAEVRTNGGVWRGVEVSGGSINFRASRFTTTQFNLFDTRFGTDDGSRVGVQFPLHPGGFGVSASIERSAVRDIESSHLIVATDSVDLGNTVNIDFGVACGNGRLDPGEDCDDGNDLFGDRCGDVDCRGTGVDTCGNGIVEAGERCDDGNMQYDDGCDLACQDVVVAVCGNGRVECPSEGCDDGNTIDGDGCSRQCVREFDDVFQWEGDDTVDPFSPAACALWSGGVLPQEGDGVVVSGRSIRVDRHPRVLFDVQHGGQALFSSPVDLVTLTALGHVRIEVTQGGITKALLVDEGGVLVNGDAPLVVTAAFINKGSVGGGPISVRSPIGASAFVSASNVDQLELGGDGAIELLGDVVAGTLRFVASTTEGDEDAGVPIGIRAAVAFPFDELFPDEVLPDSVELFANEVLPGDVAGGVPHPLEVPLRVGGDVVLGGDVRDAQVILTGGEHDVDITAGAVRRLEVGAVPIGVRSGGPIIGGRPATGSRGVTRLNAAEGIDTIIMRDGVLLLPPTYVGRQLAISNGLVIGDERIEVDELFVDGTLVAPARTEVHVFIAAGPGFISGGGELILSPTAAPMVASLAGTNLTDLTVLGDVEFEPTFETPFVIAGAFVARGSARQSLTLRSTDAGEPWTFRVVNEDLLDVDFVTVGDSHHIGAFLIDPPNFSDAGNTRGWKAGIASACGALVARSGLVGLSTDDDVIAFNASGVQCIDGDLTIGSGVTTAAITQLRVVTGAITVEGTGLTSLSAPQLTRVGNLRLVDNVALTTIDLGALDRVDGDLLLQGSPALVDIDLAKLSRVGGDLILDELGTANIDLTELDAVGGDLVITDNVALEDLDIGVRVIGGDLVISENDLLDRLSLVVVIVGGSVSVRGNDGLAALILQLLERVGGSVAIYDNDGLKQADLRALTNVGGDLSIHASGINVGDLQSVGGSTTLVGDHLVLPDDLTCDAAGVCAPPAEADADGDGIVDALDNCGTIPNSDQRDTDSDFVGDACDRDDDDDGIADADDEEPLVATSTSDDADGDGVRDDLDGCPDDADIAQADPDGDGRGAVCDDDSDGDGLANDSDPCPLVVGVDCFDDADGDGVANADDSCPTLADAGNDSDGDGLGDACDSDADGDDVPDLIDVCPDIVDDQVDTDSDGVGDACDPCPDVGGSVGGCPVVVGIAPIAREPPDPQAPDVTQGCTCAAASGADVGAAAIALLALFGWRRRRWFSGVVTAGIVAGIVTAGPAVAVTRTWTGAVNSTWSEPDNWAPAGVPGPDDDLIVASSRAIVRIDTDTPVASLAIDAGVVIVEVIGFTAGAIRIDGGVFLADAAELIRTEALTLDAGVLSAPLEIQIGRELRLRDGFVNNGGTVALSPTAGNTVAVDLVDATLADFVVEGSIDVAFAPGSRLMTNGLLRVIGDAGGRASLAGVGGQRWFLDARGAVEVDVVRVADCKNVGFLISPTDFEDGGNNVGWGLPPSLCAERATLVGSFVLLSNDDVVALESTGAECLVGDLVIGGGVTRLELITLEVVIGRIIVRNSAVENIFLEALVQAAALTIEASPALTSISAPALVAVEADLSMRDDRALETIELPALENVGGDLIIENNDAVLALTLPLTEGVGGDLILDDCDGIETFSSNVANIGGGLIVTSNGSLTTLSMSALQNVGGDLVIIDNDVLIDVEMASLASVGGDLICNDNDSLPLLFMELLAELGGSALLVGNDALASVSLDALRAIGKDLFVVNNPALVTLLMSNLASIGDDLTVLGNLQLVVLTLPTLQNIGGDLVITENPLLQTFSVPALSRVGGDLVIVDNQALDDIDLSGLTSCGGDLVIEDNAELCITSCENLSDVGGELIIEGEPVLPRGVRCGNDGRCGPIFGDGLIVLNERCDDANTDDGDGCSRGAFDPGFRCAAGEPTVCERDVDNDQVIDVIDRCPGVADADQVNTDGDAFGDACDRDDDNDGVPDDLDSCPTVPNADQQNVRCDEIIAPDDDRDNDGVLDANDICPDVPDVAQADTDRDGVGDGCDDDDDNDGINDSDDPCPLIAGACAGDADGDGIADDEDVCPTLATPTTDSDGDGLGDACDSDDDGDRVPDVRDGCPLIADPDQRDADGDGFGDVCDRCPGEDDNDTDSGCGPIVPETPATAGCSAAGRPSTPLLLVLSMLVAVRRRPSRRQGSAGADRGR